MPTYDYRCPNGHDFEHFFRKISDATAELACPQCEAVGTRRVSGGAGLVFKGSGFYLTDYGKNAHRTSGTAGAGSSSTGDSGGDAKPPVKTESSTSDSGGSSARSDSSASSASKSDGGKSSETKASSNKAKGGESK